MDKCNELNSKKRIRSINWDEDEKQLLRSILKDYASIIENKSLDCNSNKKKIKAWEEVHAKFNELNGRPRELNQLKVQWKAMKINARKTLSTFKKEANRTGGGARPKTPDDAVTEVKDLLNPAELLIDVNEFDCDGIIPSTSKDTSEKCINTEKDSKPLIITSTNLKNQDGADIIIETIEDVDAQVDAQEISILVSQDDPPIMNTPKNTNMNKLLEKEVPRRKLKSNLSESRWKSRKDCGDYAATMINYSKILKDEEHVRKMEMAEEEHAVKMEIHKEKLKSVILEREILELKKEELVKSIVSNTK